MTEDRSEKNALALEVLPESNWCQLSEQQTREQIMYVNGFCKWTFHGIGRILSLSLSRSGTKNGSETSNFTADLNFIEKVRVWTESDSL